MVVTLGNKFDELNTGELGYIKNSTCVPLSPGWPSLKFQPTHTHFALISKLQVALTSLFNMVQINFSVLFLFLAATVAPVAARPVNQPNRPQNNLSVLYGMIDEYSF